MLTLLFGGEEEKGDSRVIKMLFVYLEGAKPVSGTDVVLL